MKLHSPAFGCSPVRMTNEPSDDCSHHGSQDLMLFHDFPRFPLSLHSWADAAVSSCVIIVSESPNNAFALDQDPPSKQTAAAKRRHLCRSVPASYTFQNACIVYAPPCIPVAIPCLPIVSSSAACEIAFSFWDAVLERSHS